MLTQKQLVNTSRVHLLATEGPLPAIGQDSNLLLPLPQGLSPGTRHKMALGLAGKSLVVCFSHPMRNRIRKGLIDFTCLLPSPT